jgi:hypothetical protein
LWSVWSWSMLLDYIMRHGQRNIKIVLRIPNCKSRWRCVGAVKPQPLYPQRNTPWYPLFSGWVHFRNLRVKLVCIMKWSPVVQRMHCNRHFYSRILKILTVYNCRKSIGIYVLHFRCSYLKFSSSDISRFTSWTLINRLRVDTKGANMTVGWWNGHVAVSGQRSWFVLKKSRFKYRFWDQIPWLGIPWLSSVLPDQFGNNSSNYAWRLPGNLFFTAICANFNAFK